MDHMIEVTLAGLTLPCALRYRETAVFPPSDPDAERVGIDPVRLTQEDWDYYITRGSDASPMSEYSLLTAAFSDALMDFDRLVIHGVALRWGGRAWLICAPSGVGKSTQARWLQTLRPGEFSVICGDRPILQFCHSERSAAEPKNPSSPSSVGAVIGRPPEAPILVHPSPWNGKENWYGAPAAPLAGVILLRRGEENRLDVLKPWDASIPVFAQVIQSAVRADRIHRSAALITELLRQTPVWQLTTYRPPESTKLLLEHIFTSSGPRTIPEEGSI